MDIKTVCAYCGAWISGPLSSKMVSHGACRGCSQAVKDTLDGKNRYMLFKNPRDNQDYCKVSFTHLNAKYLDKMKSFGYEASPII